MITGRKHEVIGGRRDGRELTSWRVEHDGIIRHLETLVSNLVSNRW